MFTKKEYMSRSYNDVTVYLKLREGQRRRRKVVVKPLSFADIKMGLKKVCDAMGVSCEEVKVKQQNPIFHRYVYQGECVADISVNADQTVSMNHFRMLEPIL